MRAVLDTNVVIAGLLWRGAPHEVLEHAISGRLHCMASAPLIAEFERVLTYDRLARRCAQLNRTVADLVIDYLTLVEIVDVAEIRRTVIADPDDDVLLATAVSASADVIVSGDAHILNLKQYQGISTISPVECLERLRFETL